jgi:hypothetical protein
MQVLVALYFTIFKSMYCSFIFKKSVKKKIKFLIMAKADDSKKKELCILIKVTDTEFNYQLKGRESRIGQYSQ